MKPTSARNRAFSILCATLLAITAIVIPLDGASADAADKRTVVFVCLHGSVKSQIAAAHFNRIAAERGLNVTAISRGIEPDSAIPAGIRAALARDGLAPQSEVPAGLRGEEASQAAGVFAFDEVPSDRKGTAKVTLWSDVPPASQDYKRSRDAIVRHLEEVVDRLGHDASAQ
jgi:protein-tyrosine-phosphatase